MSVLRTMIQHLLDNNKQEILSRSIMHCHLKGLHSIMLLESPGKTIRLYVVDDPTSISKNTHDHLLAGHPLTLAFHPHHCNLTLICIAGEIQNWCIQSWNPSFGDHVLYLHSWKYQSQILTGEMGFTKMGEVSMASRIPQDLTPGQAVFMDAKEIHTVSCAVPSAWIVMEGQEDPTYESVCYSNNDIVVDQDLYQPMSEEDLMRLLVIADLC